MDKVSLSGKVPCSLEGWKGPAPSKFPNQLGGQTHVDCSDADWQTPMDREVRGPKSV